VFKQLFV